MNLPDKDFKSTVLNIFKEIKETVNKELDKVKSLTSQQIIEYHKEIGNIKKSKMGILELKSALLKLKIEIFINSFEQAEKRISNLNIT